MGMEHRTRDVVIVGGGPAGLATAAAAAARGLDVLLLERRSLPADKACGEGLLPRTVRALDALGALGLIAPADAHPIRSLGWIQEDGTFATAPLPAPGGLGVRRLALSAALARRAESQGAELRQRCAALSHRREAGRVVVATAEGEVAGRLLVAADGLASAVREREGLERRVAGRRRFGLRRHYATPPWSDAVEVHFAPGVEAYVTPAGAELLDLAFLFEERTASGFDGLLARFPRLAERLAGARPCSPPLGAGPLRRATRCLVTDGLVLAGDAGGYLDAITGEGLSLAFEGALELASLLPDALAKGTGETALRPFQRAMRARYRRSAAVARLVLGMARHPRLRQRVIRQLARRPHLFERMVQLALG
jgi:flavin-dependent dehydrogenase